ncbi:zonular occludens toxin domain-containing protein [Kingella negevensis]|uniref:zonular occludens toxin domain-containing protein n=1 Tax=Kingella negevensis TaxID=1522312 RepID=UPI00254317A6|nr:zonular occludens toxin domain-containing protein [Kingella negevensis]WII92510.1 zonular occludens toxin domain-containing protein [Kingella negevensis]
MIYLITGNMGTGKTSRAVNMILTNEDGLFTMTLEDGSVIPRPFYFCHIDGLDTKKFNAHELTKEQIQSAPLDEIIPTGAVLIIDEAHWIYPVRSAASKVPEYIQKLSELRHDGFTLILMTQHPSQLDVFVRNLVSKHIHLERKSLGMKQYWWYKCVTSLDNPAALSGTESSNWKPPEEAFKYYKSSSQHQKFKKQIPLAVWALIVIIGFIGWKGYNVYSVYDKNVNKPKEAQYENTASTPLASQSHQNFDVQSQNQLNASLKPTDFVPTLAERPESKPIYDSVRQVKQYERIAGCFKGGLTDCTCYSDQATKLKEISKEMCLDYAENGLPFDPFREHEYHSNVQITQQNNRLVGAQVAEFGGEALPSLNPVNTGNIKVIQ